MILDKLRTWLFGSVRRQLITGVALVHAVMMSLFIWDLTSRQQDMLLDQQTSHAKALARSAATSAAGWLLARDVTGLQEIIDAQADYPELRFAMALDRNGAVLAHSDRQYRGQYLADLPNQATFAILRQTPALVDVISPAMVAGQHVGWIRIGVGQKASTEQLSRITRNGFLYALAAILSGGLLAGLIGARLTRRLHAIQSVADAIKAGQSDLRAPDQGEDEAARLARRFNEMLDTLARREREAVASRDALHRSEARLSKVMAITGEGIWDWDMKEGRVRHNTRWCEMLGLSAERMEHPLAVFAALLHEDDREAVMARIQRCLEGDGKYWSEHRMRGGDGRVIWVQDRGDVVERDPAGRPLRMLGSITDITERKHVEEELRLTQFSLDRAPEGVFWLNKDGRIGYVNDESCRSLGYTREELLGMHVWDFDPDFRPERWPRQWADMRRLGARSFETRHRRKDGTIHPVEISVVQTTYGDREHHTAFVRDISRRKADEALLHQDREQQKVLRQMLEDVVKGGPLKETLEACLTRLLEVTWLSLLPKGGIFLMAEDGQTLRLTVSRNLSAEILSLCDRVPLGRCHCGVAAASREMQFSHCVDGRHEISYPGMAEHGHYNLPLLSEGEVVGVMVLYLPHGFERDPVKEQFLGSVADVLAGFIRRKHAEEALKQLNEELEDRVEERTIELVTAKVEAERASRAKSEFLSRMSHELRTPLNAILGFGQLLELGIREEEQADNVQEILHAGRHLLELINEVLDLARIESGKFAVSMEAVPLLPLLEDCLTLMRPQIEARGIHVVAAGHDCGAQVRADRVRLKQVLLNLLSNAVKYNREQGTLSIVCVPAGDAVQIRISDTGMGLTAAQQARLFTAFERLDADQSAVEGSGIGLALSKRLVELMEGGIGAESTPKQGSTFWVRLPIVDGHQEPSHPAAAESAGRAARPVGRQRWDILCIEDNPANLRLIERILARRQDIRLLSASTPGLGLELAAARQPALILLDINLPDMDGYDVMKRLRESEATRDIPVVAISANAMPKDLARGKAAGFVDYLTKPLEVERLLQVMDDTLARTNSSDNRPL